MGIPFPSRVRTSLCRWRIQLIRRGFAKTHSTARTPRENRFQIAFRSGRLRATIRNVLCVIVLVLLLFLVRSKLSACLLGHADSF